MRVKHNISSMNSYRNYNTNNSVLSKDLEKLSSGYKINRSADDAAGLAISEKMRAQINGIEGAVKNAKDGISLIQTAEGALTEVHGMLDRMTSLAEQSANGTYDNEVDRAQLQKEVESLKTEVDRIADSSNYNGIKLLDGSLAGGAGAVFGKGATLAGGNVAYSKQASVKSGYILTDLTAVDPTKATKDYLSIDGKKVVLDYANDQGAKELAGMVQANLSGGSDAILETIAKKFEEVINNAATEQGANASIKVSVDAGNGMLIFKSADKTPASEFSYLGNNAADATDAQKGVMHSVLSGSTSTPDKASINNAVNTYDGPNITSPGDSFQMKLNGVTLGLSASISTGDSMSVAASALQGAIQTAVDNYNQELGLQPGQEDTTNKSGLTGLKSSEFTVSEGDNGNFIVRYMGNEDVEFSFSDVGEREVAKQLGLAGGSSSSGAAGGLSLQIGETADSYNHLTVSVADMHTSSLGIRGVDVSTQEGASSAMDAIKKAINMVSDTRGGLGALQNRLEHTIGNLGVMRENIQSAESLIRDTDVAEQMMNYTKNNILNQSAQAMLAQANQLPQGVMQLLQG